jgi:histidine triad (HIT) family protein
MASIFTKIVNGEIPCHKILENETFLAFLDVRPVAVGHTLVIPKQEMDYIFDMDDVRLGELMAFAKKVAKMIKKQVPCIKVGIMVAGLEVPHVHIHLVPIQKVSDLNFANAKAADPEVLSQLAKRISAV